MSIIYENYLGDGSPEYYKQLWANRWRAMSFVPSATHTIANIEVLLNRTGNCGTVAVELQGDSSGEPDNTAIDSGTIAQSLIPAGDSSTGAVMISVNLTTAPEVVAASRYWIVVKALEGTNVVNCVKVHTDENGGIGTVMSTIDGGVNWSEIEDRDMIFAVYGPGLGNARTRRISLRTRYETD